MGKFKIIAITAVVLAVGSVLVYTQRPFDSHFENVVPKNTVDVIIPKGASDSDCGKCYIPNTVRVVLGDNNTVRWTNLDYVPSSVISDKRLFDSGPILPNKTWSLVFPKVGSFQYHSEPHPWMKGEIIVTKKEYAQ